MKPKNPKSSSNRNDVTDGIDTPRLALSVRAACWSIDISRAKLYQLMKTGQLAYVLIGSRRVIPIAAIESLLRGTSQVG